MLKSNRHLFVIDPLDSLNLARDTTIKLAFALVNQGTEVFFTEVTGLSRSLHPTSCHALAHRVSFGGTTSQVSLSPIAPMELREFAVIHMRKEPPYDLDYISALWMLQAVEGQVKILNSPRSLQRINEKLAILDFPEFTRPALISCNPEELLEFSQAYCHSNIVLKPLDLYGGRGVIHLHDSQTLEEDLRRETEGGKKVRLVQPFEPKVMDGEVRVFLAGGNTIAWCLKVPSAENFLANTRAGSRLSEYTPSPREVQIAQKVGDSLLKEGVYFAGLDLIAGWLSEVNITCPALLRPDRESLEGFDLMARQIMGIT